MPGCGAELLKGSLYIGWSRVDITPDRPVYLQGQFYDRISEYVQSPILATFLALETQDQQGNIIDQAIIGSCDLCVIHADVLVELRRRLAGLLPDFDGSKLFLSATHIHTGPSTRELNLSSLVECCVPREMLPTDKAEPGVMRDSEYREFLLGCLTRGCTEAWQNRARGYASRELGFAVLGHNRRVTYDDGSALMYGTTNTINYMAPEGPEDHGVEMMYFWDSQEQLTGVLVNAALPAQVLEHKRFISSDYWGEARRELAARCQKPVFLLPQCAAAGDQSPRDLVRRGRGEPDMFEIEGAVELGHRVVELILSKLQPAAQHKQDVLVLAHRSIGLDLPLRTVTRREMEQAKQEIAKILAAKKPGEKISPEDRFSLYPLGGILDRFEQQQSRLFYSAEIHVLRIGESAMATSPFELFMEYGLQIKARSQAQQTFLVQLACDCGMYLPTQKAIAGGHYSAIVASGYVGPDGGKLLVNRTIEEINRLWPDEAP